MVPVCIPVCLYDRAGQWARGNFSQRDIYHGVKKNVFALKHCHNVATIVASDQFCYKLSVLLTICFHVQLSFKVVLSVPLISKINVCPTNCLVQLSVCPSVCLSNSSSVQQSVYPFDCMSNCLYVQQFVGLSVFIRTECLLPFFRTISTSQ